MPFTENQLKVGANYQLDYFLKNDPIDQINTRHPLYSALIAKKKETVGSNEYEVEQVRFTNDSNYQNFFGADQVTFNEKDTVRQAKYKHFNFHDGFAFDEDTLRANGIIITEDEEATPTKAEKVQLTNRLKESFETLKLGAQENLDKEMHLDGTQSAKACPGLDHLISTTPNVGIVGGIDASTAEWWRNNTNLSIPQGSLVDEMELSWRACTRFGNKEPDLIVVGSDFLDAYRREAGLTINRQIHDGGNQRGGVSLDASVTKTFFKGVELVWDPTMDALDDIVGPQDHPWAKRAYFLNTSSLFFKPLAGDWMKKRKPPRVYDRYVHYWAITGSYRMTCNQRNANAVLSIY